MVKQKNCIKIDQHVYNSCYELRSRAIKKKPRSPIIGTIASWLLKKNLKLPVFLHVIRAKCVKVASDAEQCQEKVLYKSIMKKNSYRPVS